MATHMLSRYNDLVVNKYGEDVTSQPELGDVELWTEAVGGVKKGRIYGFSASYDPQLVMIGIPSTIRSTELGTSEEVRLLKEELKKRYEELKKRYMRSLKKEMSRLQSSSGHLSKGVSS